jgi:hypothetical protein
MDPLDKYDDIINILTNGVEIDGKEYKLKDEFEKFFIRGNKSSGIRIRKIMQFIKKSAQDVRDDIQEYKKSL